MGSKGWFMLTEYDKGDSPNIHVRCEWKVCGQDYGGGESLDMFIRHLESLAMRHCGANGVLAIAYVFWTGEAGWCCEEVESIACKYGNMTLNAVG